MDAATNKHTWRVVLAYDGTDFHGWQVQPGCSTIQGELSAAIESLVGERVLPQGSGRTDAGVHALAQNASFQLAANIPRENLLRALNRRLPAAIRVLQAHRVAQEFHARHSALGKTYEYRIFRGDLCSPWLTRYALAVRHPLDVEAMRKAAQAVLGEHDFTSFAATEPDLKRRTSSSAAVIATNVAGDAAARSAPDRGLDSEEDRRGNLRRIFASSWLPGKSSLPNFAVSDSACGQADNPAGGRKEEHLPGDGFRGHVSPGDDLLIYRVHGSGFLHHMVRNLVGTFLDVGRGYLAADAIPGILAARSRSKAGPTAPARGLFLASVNYPSQFDGSQSG